MAKIHIQKFYVSSDRKDDFKSISDAFPDLFTHSSRYRTSQLVRDGEPTPEGLIVYRSFDVWTSQEHFERFKAEHSRWYRAIDNLVARTVVKEGQTDWQDE